MAHTDPTLTGEDALGPHAKVNHETTDISLVGTTRIALFSIGAIGFVFLLMWGAWGLFLKQARAADPGKPAMATRPAVRLRSRDSSRKNGRKNCPTSSRMLNHSQPWLMRSRYQGISSGRFADQMIRNCENEK